MPSLSRRDVVNALTGKLHGEEQPKKDHKVYRFTLPDGRWRRTKVSHGRQHDIAPEMVNAMANQLKLTTAEFVGAVRCDLSEDEFWQILGDRI